MSPEPYDVDRARSELKINPQGLSLKRRRAPPPDRVGMPAPGAYNPAMIHTLQSLLAPALMDRLVLVVNHVLAAEPAALHRLQPHSASLIRLQLQGWPALLPPPPTLVWRITPAGLMEWCGAAEASTQGDLRITVDAANPLALMARAATGQMPAVDIEGNAQLAADINWLLQNVRWDVAADLERLFGPAVAHSLHRLGSALAKGLRSATQAGAGVAERMRPAAP